LANGSSYTYYVRCIDASGNANTSDLAISFSVGSVSTCNDCGLGTPVITPVSPIASQTFTMTCPANASGYDCINAYANGSSNKCTFGSYSGNNAIYTCTGMITGTYTSRCVAVTGTSRNCCANVKTGSYNIQALADTTPPSQITSLATSNLAQNSITLNWTAPGDDGSTGKATSYDVRYSTASITSSNWASAILASGEPAPSTSGTAQSFTILGLTANTTYYLAIRATDDAGNISTLSNVPSGKTLTTTGACYGAEACNPTGNPIGGGAGYTRIITETDSRVKYVVTNKDQLLSALNSAKSGEVVFVPSSATIDLTGASTVTIPAGVILASDRGYNGRTGGLIKRDNSSTIPKATFMVGGNNVRFTGLRIQGPHSGYNTNYGDDVKCAIMEENKNGLEVDNCEIYYWSYAGVAFENNSNNSWTGHVHHNYIHNISGMGYGYGVMVAYGDVLIEANNFDYTRHAVIGEGCPGEKFEYRYNSYGANSINPVLDCHRDCGGWSAGGVSGRLYLVHHNTIIYSGSVTFNLYGTPSEGAYINNNRFTRPVQALNGSTRIFMTNNYIGSTFYSQGPIN
jgi:hypothetical protein